MEEITGFGMKNKITLPSLGWKQFNRLRDERVERIHTKKDNIMWWLVRQITKAGSINAFKQYNKSKIAENFLADSSEELNVRVGACEVNDAYVEYVNENKKKQFKKKLILIFMIIPAILKKNYVQNQLSILPTDVELREFTLMDV